MALSELAVELKASDWVFASSFKRWVDAKYDADSEADEAGNTENLPGNMWRKWRDEGDEEGEDIA